ncbi:MAG: hypothetical protein OXC44_04155 [Proteobacteria bacterium]|nr:hypothetical protein [Pseudomonadota bacterium]
MVYAESDLSIRDSDQRVSMVVGGQRILEPPFDSQVVISKKGVVNVKWLSDGRVLLTALRSGVILFDPTPVSESGRRLLIDVKTVYQARKAAPDVMSRSKKTQSLSKEEIAAASLKTLLSQSWFQQATTIRSHSEVAVDCFHPAKKKVLQALMKHFAERFIVCKNAAYHLMVKVKTKNKGKREDVRPVLWFSGELPDSDDATHGDVLQEWKIRVSPSKKDNTYQLTAKNFVVDIKHLGYYSGSLQSRDISFSYTIKAGDASSSGHVWTPYTLADSLLLSELVYEIRREKSSWNRYTENLPILGVLLSSSSQKQSKEGVEVYFSLSPLVSVSSF